MWFDKRANQHLIDGGLLYPLQQTALRGNVQIQLSKLENLEQCHSEFLIVIHNGADRAYYVPYSWLRQKVLPTSRIRRRPRDQHQRYLTVDELRNQTHIFSFGLDRNGDPLRFDLTEFLNTINSASELTSFLERYRREHRIAFPEFSSSDAPYVLTRQEVENRYNVTWSHVRHRRLPPLLKALRDRGFTWDIREGNNLVVSHPEAEADAEDVAEVYSRLLRSGRISTTHVATEAEWRPYQRGLRDACLHIYGYHCAMCDVDIRSALTASHIKPAALDRRNRANLRNVVLLCQLHDSLFDRKLLTIRPDFRIACSPKLVSSSKVIRDWVFGIEGQTISRPSNYLPDPVFLTWHARKSGIRV